jgi:uncharacterized protein YeeX (DUF496 family)
MYMYNGYILQIPSKLKEALKQVKDGIEQRLRDDQKLVSLTLTLDGYFQYSYLDPQ